MKTLLSLLLSLLISCNQGISTATEKVSDTPASDIIQNKINYKTIGEQLGQYESDCFVGSVNDYKYTLYFYYDEINGVYYLQIKKYDYVPNYSCISTYENGLISMQAELQDFTQTDEGVKIVPTTFFYTNKKRLFDRDVCTINAYGLDLVSINYHQCGDLFIDKIELADGRLTTDSIFSGIQFYPANINTALYE